jgi:hypothetical protein
MGGFTTGQADGHEQARRMMGQQSMGQDSSFGGFMRPRMPPMGPDGQPAIAPNMGQVNRFNFLDRMRQMRGGQGGFTPPNMEQLPGQGQGQSPVLQSVLQYLRSRQGR